MNNTLNLDLEIATANAANSSTWNNSIISWRDLVYRLSQTHRTPENIRAYLAMSKAEQGTIKDVGGYVGGYCVGGKRGMSSVIRRSMLTLDLDFANYNFWDRFTMFFGCAAVLHSTHKHTAESPRYRLIIPLDRSVAPDEHQAIARKVAELLNMELFDPTTFDTNRLMFWASTSIDGEFVFKEQDGYALNADSVLNMYSNWRDVSQWAQHSAHKKRITLGIDKQADPELKKGSIGAFCRTYDIETAINTFLPDVYRKYTDDRYTYVHGSTEGGLRLFDNKFAYSHHSTDPAMNELCNAFDLVRIHKFGVHDTDSTVTGSKLPSFKMMEQFAREDENTRKLIISENLGSAMSEFSAPYTPAVLPVVSTINNLINITNSTEDPNAWTTKLEIDKQGNFLSTAANISLIVKNDPVLKDAFAYNDFDNKRYLKRSIAWRNIDSDYALVKDVDYSGVRNYIDCIYGISSVQKIDDVLALEFNNNRFHPIRNYLDGLVWDGVHRIDELLIRYMGAEDNIYTREAIRKSLVAAVARVRSEGVKFDSVVVLCGEEGAGKSTFFKKLGRDWFSDTFTTVQGKEAFEQLHGHWIIEIAELAGLRKAEAETIKHFISKQEDSFRPAYGRTVETYKRQCVFFGTSNKQWFLKESGGNRRFLPIDIDKKKIINFVWDGTLDACIDLIWAEADALYKSGESLVLSPEAEKLAAFNRDAHSDTDDRSGIIQDYLDMLLPEQWDVMSLDTRRAYVNSPEQRSKGVIKRDVVCLAEIWCECLGKNKEDMSRYNTRDINDIIRSLKIWDAKKSTKSFKIYGTQRYYERNIL